MRTFAIIVIFVIAIAVGGCIQLMADTRAENTRLNTGLIVTVDVSGPCDGEASCLKHSIYDSGRIVTTKSDPDGVKSDEQSEPEKVRKLESVLENTDPKQLARNTKVVCLKKDEIFADGDGTKFNTEAFFNYKHKPITVKCYQHRGNAPVANALRQVLGPTYGL